jgi:hypothetical protein
MTESDRAPDWSIWRYLTDVPVSQAVALSVNIDPLTPRPHAWMAGGGAPRAFFSAGPTFTKRLFLAEQEIGKTLPPAMNWRERTRGAEPTVKLVTFVRWARSVEWEMPAELLELAGSAEQSARSGAASEPQAADAAPRATKPTANSKQTMESAAREYIATAYSEGIPAGKTDKMLVAEYTRNGARMSERMMRRARTGKQG